MRIGRYYHRDFTSNGYYFDIESIDPVMYKWVSYEKAVPLDVSSSKSVERVIRAGLYVLSKSKNFESLYNKLC